MSGLGVVRVISSEVVDGVLIVKREMSDWSIEVVRVPQETPEMATQSYSREDIFSAEDIEEMDRPDRDWARFNAF